ncbi:MAG: hypothetical protein GEU99_11270 [Luteitalea sp.]|nr:hypothetical protein [Luteitalea sp.]
MDVFLVPVGEGRCEPYCEVSDEVVPAGAAATAAGWRHRLMARFREMLAAAERERARAREAAHEEGSAGLGTRLKRQALRWIAERIAEQRLLWHLRRQTEVTLLHPDDMNGDQAQRIVRAALERDANRHWRWLIVDALLFALSGLLVLVPGPNVVAYYFAFRVVGHLLSWRGARHGLAEVVWHPTPSRDLAALRTEVARDRTERRPRVRALAERLRLEHLPTFFDRMTLGRA